MLLYQIGEKNQFMLTVPKFIQIQQKRSNIILINEEINKKKIFVLRIYLISGHMLAVVRSH